MNTELGKRIIILGCSGSGKSTFAKKLKVKTDLPLYHLDNIWWNEDRTHISRDEFDKKQKELIQKDSWIIDGNYGRTYEMRIKACDTVIFLDYSEEVCLKGISARVGKERSDIPWTEDSLNPELVKWVKEFHTQDRPKVYSLLKKYPDKQVFIFTTRSQADKWLTDL